MTASASPLVGVIMGSKSDYEHLAPAIEILQHLGIPVVVDSMDDVTMKPAAS